MSHPTHRAPQGRTAILLLALLASGLPTGAASRANQAEAQKQAQARYQQERAACLNGQSNQDRATCLKEAGAALSEARRGGLDDDSSAYSANQRQRCERLSGDEQQACLARMDGRGSTRGSVAEGGILRELVVRDAPPAASASPALPAPPAPTTTPMSKP